MFKAPLYLYGKANAPPSYAKVEYSNFILYDNYNASAAASNSTRDEASNKWWKVSKQMLDIAVQRALAPL
jgi:hypothetical protein